MIATSATLGGFPAASRASYLAFIAASNRTATSAGRSRAWRSGARPPRMKRLPRCWPESRAIGARPARLAAHLC
jgi:hypothetical protein